MIKYPSRVQAYTSGIGALSVAPMALVLGCAHHSVDRDAAFRRIQVHEAQVARADAALNRESGCSDGTLARAQELCAASRAVCEESQQLHDRDATDRCLAANASCAGARERTRVRCATDRKR